MRSSTMKGWRGWSARSEWWMPGRRAAVFLVTTFFLLSLSPVLACVGKILVIGVVNSPQEIIYAELIAQLVTERTGTTVKVVPYKDVLELYGAVKKGEVGILIENTERGMKMVERSRGENGKSAYETLKREYRKSYNLVWLEPLSTDGGSRYYAPVIATETMGNLPALPKLINRLTGVLTEETYTKLTRAAKGEEKPRRVARDFLKAKKLI